jgi:hypothetical protein
MSERIVITVNPDGILSYSDHGFTHVGPNQAVSWICATHDYAIQFANDAWPFHGPSVVLSKRAGQSTEPCTTRGRGKKTTKFNSYKYTVCVHVPGSPTPIVTDDPVIIVEDG